MGWPRERAVFQGGGNLALFGGKAVQMVKMTVLGGHRSLEAAPTYQHPPPGGWGAEYENTSGFPLLQPPTATSLLFVAKDLPVLDSS